MLKQLAENLWVYEEPASRLGFEFGARMTIIRLASGEIFLHSPLEISSELKNEIDALGQVRFVVSPYRFHYLNMADCFGVYPHAHYYAPPGLDTKSLPEVSFHARLKDRAPVEWKNDLEQLVVRGNALDNEVVFFHGASKTLVCADLCFNIPSTRPPLTRAVARALGVLDHFGPSLNFKIFERNKAQTRQSIERILGWDFERVIISHGEVIERGGREKLRDAFAWLGQN
jgi:hypothetical protein